MPQKVSKYNKNKLKKIENFILTRAPQGFKFKWDLNLNMDFFLLSLSRSFNGRVA